MNDTWFKEYAEELGRCLEDARLCADACERLLASLEGHEDRDARRAVARAVLAPAAVAQVLIDLIDQPMELVLGAMRLCHESARAAVESLESLGDGRALEATAALRECATSCAALLDVV